MTMRKAMWGSVIFAAVMAILGVAINQPGLIGIGVLAPVVLLPAAWIALLVMGVRWTLTGDKHGTIGGAAKQGAERLYVVRGKDQATGAPREMRVVATSPKEAAASAAHLGIVGVTEIV